MATIRIGSGYAYERTGSPTQKMQRHTARMAALIFADLLPASGSRKPQERSAGSQQTRGMPKKGRVLRNP